MVDAHAALEARVAYAFGTPRAEKPVGAARHPSAGAEEGFERRYGSR